MTQVEITRKNKKLTTDAKRRYRAGESIRHIALETGTSYGKIHRLLADAGVKFRPRGGPRPSK